MPLPDSMFLNQTTIFDDNEEAIAPHIQALQNPQMTTNITTALASTELSPTHISNFNKVSFVNKYTPRQKKKEIERIVKQREWEAATGVTLS